MYPFQIGGPQVVTYNLVRQFGKKGLDVELVLGISKQDLSRTRSLSEQLGFSSSVGITPVVKNAKCPSSYRNRLDHEFLRDTVRIGRKILSNSDVVHFQSVPATRDVAVPLLARIRATPTVFRSGGWLTAETFGTGNFPMYYQFFAYKMMSGLFTRVICNSLYSKEKTVIEGVDESRVEVIPNGVDVKKFREARIVALEGDPKLVFAGRLATCKGIERLIKSMRTVCANARDAVLHIVGDGPLKGKLEQLIVSEGLAGRVILHGKVTSGLESYYKSADICVFPSSYEPFGITIIEAMAAGSPIVATNTGGVPENVTNMENGILVSPTNREEELANAIISLWSDKNLMRHMTANNLKRALIYDWPTIADRYVELYDRIARNSSTSI